MVLIKFRGEISFSVDPDDRQKDKRIERMDQRMGDLDRQSRVILRNQLQPYFHRFENDGIYYDKPENLFSMTADADAFEHQKQLDAAETGRVPSSRII